MCVLFWSFYRFVFFVFCFFFLLFHCRTRHRIKKEWGRVSVIFNTPLSDCLNADIASRNDAPHFILNSSLQVLNVTEDGCNSDAPCSIANFITDHGAGVSIPNFSPGFDWNETTQVTAPSLCFQFFVVAFSLFCPFLPIYGLLTNVHIYHLCIYVYTVSMHWCRFVGNKVCAHVYRSIGVDLIC